MMRLVHSFTALVPMMCAVALLSCGSDERPATTSSGSAEQSAAPPPVADSAAAPVGDRELRGLVFEDRNRNGVVDEGDARLAGLPVVLTDPDTSTEISSVDTGADGTFRFDRLLAQAYRISVRVPAGFERTNDDSFVVNLGAGPTVPEVRFGIAPQK